MVRKMPFYKRYPSNCISGMLGLGLEEKGLYNLFMDLCYDRAGAIQEDQAELARMAGCGPRMYRRVRDALLSKGKLIRTEDRKIIVRGFRDATEGHADAERPETAGNAAGNGPRSAGNGGKTGAQNDPDRAKSKGSPIDRASTRARFQNPDSRIQSDSSLAVRFCEELGITFDATDHNQANWQSILETMVVRNDLDFDLDILAAVRYLRDMGTLPATLRTPGFFRPDALRLATLRRSGKPKATVHVIGPKVEDMSRNDWAKRLHRFIECGIWIGPGADPTCFACIAPPDLLAGCRAKWTEQGDHPEYADTDCNFRWQPEGPRMRGVIWPRAKAIELEAKQA
jgi:uncharacterized protein YdaU (DUF1376 family)